MHTNVAARLDTRSRSKRLSDQNGQAFRRVQIIHFRFHVQLGESMICSKKHLEPRPEVTLHTQAAKIQSRRHAEIAACAARTLPEEEALPHNLIIVVALSEKASLSIPAIECCLS
jgi:hypothetical protein